MLFIYWFLIFIFIFKVMISFYMILIVYIVGWIWYGIVFVVVFGIGIVCKNYSIYILFMYIDCYMLKVYGKNFNL